MKVLDMFVCHVPVCAIGFECLKELVVDGVNGRVFGSGDELAEQLKELLRGYPNDGGGKELEKYKRNIEGMVRWRENWEECARDLVVGDWEEDEATRSTISRRDEFHWIVKFLVFAVSYSVMYWFTQTKIKKEN